MISIVFLMISCNFSCGIAQHHTRIDERNNWNTRKNNLSEALSVEEYCVYCMGGGSQAAISRLKQTSYHLEREGLAAITAKDKMRSIIRTWADGIGIDFANYTFSKWYGYFIDEPSPYLLAMRVVNDIIDGTLSPAALGEIHSDLPKYGEEIYRIRFQQQKLLELAQDIDIYAVPPHGACGVCVRLEEERKFSEMRRQNEFYR